MADWQSSAKSCISRFPTPSSCQENLRTNGAKVFGSGSTSGQAKITSARTSASSESPRFDANLTMRDGLWPDVRRSLDVLDSQSQVKRPGERLHTPRSLRSASRQMRHSFRSPRLRLASASGRSTSTMSNFTVPLTGAQVALQSYEAPRTKRDIQQLAGFECKTSL